MLYWAAVFFVIALIAGAFGFLGIMASAAGIAKILFFAFVVLAVVVFAIENACEKTDYEGEGEDDDGGIPAKVQKPCERRGQIGAVGSGRSGWLFACAIIFRY